MINIGQDDTSYIAGLIKETASQINIDKSRVFLFGHSNGGFMAHKLACDHSEMIAGIISLAGAMHNNIDLCKPK